MRAAFCYTKSIMQPTLQTPPTPPTSINIDQVKKINRRKTIWGIVCLLLPFGLGLLAGILWGIGMLYSSSRTEISGQDPIGMTLFIAVFCLVGIAIFIFIPALIAGIVLLSTRQK